LLAIGGFSYRQEALGAPLDLTSNLVHEFIAHGSPLHGKIEHDRHERCNRGGYQGERNLLILLE